MRMTMCGKRPSLPPRSRGNDTKWTLYRLLYGWKGGEGERMVVEQGTRCMTNSKFFVLPTFLLSLTSSSSMD
ncbi:hypothetical protein WG66_003885, partial [Moniliophthora roreri]